METRISGIAFKAALLAAAFSAPAAHSGALNQGFADCRVATAAELGEMRGGFELSNGGLQLSFALERVTYINGVLTAITKLSLPSPESIAALRSIQVNSTLGNPSSTSGGGNSSSPPPTSVGDNIGNSPPVSAGSNIGNPPPVSVSSNTGISPPVSAGNSPSNPPVITATANNNPITLIQNGPKNTFTMPEGLNLSTAALTTVIQNTLDNQKISTATVINATLTSQALANALAMTSSINQALAKSIQ